MTEEDRTFNRFLVAVFLITLFVLVTAYAIQTLAN
jgi:hypothetical protein